MSARWSVATGPLAGRSLPERGPRGHAAREAGPTLLSPDGRGPSAGAGPGADRRRSLAARPLFDLAPARRSPRRSTARDDTVLRWTRGCPSSTPPVRFPDRGRARDRRTPLVEALEPASVRARAVSPRRPCGRVAAGAGHEGSLIPPRSARPDRSPGSGPSRPARPHASDGTAAEGRSRTAAEAPRRPRSA